MRSRKPALFLAFTLVLAIPVQSLAADPTTATVDLPKTLGDKAAALSSDQTQTLTVWKKQFTNKQCNAVDWAKEIGPCPKLGDPLDLADYNESLLLQNLRCKDDIDAANLGVNRRPNLFSKAAGKELEQVCPHTSLVIAAAFNDCHDALEAVKDAYHRKRPFQEHPDITPSVPLETNASYPSAHAAYGTLVAGLLSFLDPSRQAAYTDRGFQIGNYRVLGGIHHATDVLAGQKLGTEYIKLWLQDNQNWDELTKAKAEWQ